MPLTLIPPLFVNCHLPEDVSILLFDTYDDLQKRLGAKNQMKAKMVIVVMVVGFGDCSYGCWFYG